MAGYKVIQDVEAEDKFLGPLTFKQFLFAGGAAISGYILFIFATKGIWIGVAFLLPFFAFFAILAFPWSKDQPTELWLASRIRFYIMPRKRIWDQSGVKDLVEITVPKREVKIYSDGLSHDQVYSRVNALASVVDTRGWAIKNYSNDLAAEESDRLVAAAAQSTPDVKDQILASTVDVMDEQNNPLAQQFSTLMNESEQKHKQETLDMIEQARTSSAQAATVDDIPLPNVAEHPKPKSKSKKNANVNPQDLWFLNQPDTQADPNLARFQTNTVVTPGASAPVAEVGISQANIKQEDEQKLLQKVHSRQAQEAVLKQHSHLKTIQPLSESGGGQGAQSTQPLVDTAQAPISTSTTPVDPAIIALSTNDDLNVETLARQAKKDMPDDGNEVIISLR
jgi:PrgI family protein